MAQHPQKRRAAAGKVALARLAATLESRGAYPEDWHRRHAGLRRMALALVLSGPLLAAPARVSAQQGRGERGSIAVPGKQARIQPAEILPADTIFYIGLDDVSRSWDRFRKSAIYKIHTEPDVNVFTAKLLERIRKGVAAFEQRTRIKLDEVLGAFRGQLALAVIGVADNPMDGQPLPQFVVVAEEAGARESIERLVAELTGRLRDWVPGLELLTYEFEGIPVSALGFGGLKICYAHTRGLFIGALTEAAMDKVLTNLGQAKGRTLAESPAFSACRKKAHDTDLLAYLNIQRLLTYLRDEGKIDFEGERFFRITGLDRAAAVAFGAGFLGGGIRDTLIVNVTERAGLVRLLASRPSAMPAARYVPESAVVVAAARLEPRRIYDELLRLIGETEGLARVEAIRQGRAFVERQFQIDLEQQLFAGLTGEVLVYLDAPTGGGLIPDGVLLAELTDRSRFRELLFMLRGVIFKDARFQTFQYHGTVVTYGRLPDRNSPVIPTYAFRDGQFLFATSTQAIKRVIRRMEGAARQRSAPSILDKADFRRVTAAVSRERTMLVYADLQTLFGKVYGTGVYFLQNRPANRRMPIDPNRLPTPETIAQHLFGLVVALSSDEDGLTLEGYSPIGAQTALLATGAVARRLKRQRGRDRAAGLGEPITEANPQAEPARGQTAPAQEKGEGGEDIF